MLKKNVMHNINYIHQILICENAEHNRRMKLPDLIEFNSNEARRLHPEAEYILWDDKNISDLIIKNFDKSVYEAYKNITAFAYKADLARYCILYVMGGIYVDLGIRMMNYWEIPKEKGFSTFKELCFTAESWTIMQNGLIWSLPKRRELEICINWIVENYKNKFYGKTPLCPTGPVLYGRAIAAAMVEQGQSDTADDQWIGEYRWTTPEGEMKNDAYVAPDHKLIAFRTKLIPGDLSHLGLRGTNNYKEIWLSRQMYGEKTAIFSSQDERIKVNNISCTKEGFLVKLGVSGVILYGPYIKLSKGDYSLKVIFDEDVVPSYIDIDITTGGGEKYITSRCITPEDFKITNIAQIDFELSEDAALVEFVVRVDGHFSGIIKGFELVENKDIVEQKLIPKDDFIVDTCNDVKEKNFSETETIETNGVWLASDTRIKIISAQRELGGIAIAKGTRGRVTFGPYCNVSEGYYDFSIFFSSDTKFSKIIIEFAYDNGKKILYKMVKKSLFVSHRKFLSFPLHVNFNVSDMEFRVHVFGDFQGMIEKFILEKS